MSKHLEGQKQGLLPSSSICGGPKHRLQCSVVKGLTSIRISRRNCAPGLGLQPSRGRSHTQVPPARHHASVAAAAAAIWHPRHGSWRHPVVISKRRHSWTTPWGRSQSVRAANVTSAQTSVIRHACWGGLWSQHSQLLDYPQSEQSSKSFSACPVQSSAPPWQRPPRACFPSQTSLAHLRRLMGVIL